MCATCKDHTIRTGAKLASSGCSNSLRRFLILRKTRGLSEQRNKGGQSSFSCSGVSHSFYIYCCCSELMLYEAQIAAATQPCGSKGPSVLSALRSGSCFGFPTRPLGFPGI